MEGLIVLGVLGAPVGLVALIAWAALKPELRESLAANLGRAARSLPGRLVLLTVTMLVLLIPLELVNELRVERGYRLMEVQDELAAQWGGAQTVVGPILVIPVLDHSEERMEKVDDKGEVKVWYRPVVVQRDFLLLPDALEVDGQVAPQALHRGLYDVLVYDARVSLDATFTRPEFPARAGHTLEPLWREARLVVEISDLSAVSEVETLSWQDRALHPEAGTLPGASGQGGISGAIVDFAGDTAAVAVNLRMRGMGSLMAGPVAEVTQVSMGGTWDAPSFTGFTLPNERDVRSDRFTASWTVPGVARPVPQLLELGAVGLDPLRLHTVGVRLLEPASPYVSVERALTYGLLVIVLGLMSFLVLEHGLGLALHPVQWLVNGLALVVFYLVLLATSEHQGFDMAYGVASALTVGMVSGYSVLATRSARVGAAVLPALSTLYACMYAMLRSEDHALLMGTTLVVLALGCTMWVTRHLGRGEATAPPMPAPIPA